MNVINSCRKQLSERKYSARNLRKLPACNLLNAFRRHPDRRVLFGMINHYRTLFNLSRDCMLCMRLDGSIIEVNESATHTYGYSRNEFLAMNIKQLRDVATLEFVDSQMLAASKEGILFETRHRRSDGGVFPVEVSSRGLKLRGEQVLLSVIRDITARKKREEELAESEERYRSLMEQATDAVALYDADAGRFIDANGKFCKLTGYGKDDIATLVLYDLLDEDAALIEQNLAGIRKIRVLPPGVHNIRDKDGKASVTVRSATLISYRGKQIIMLVFRDITLENNLKEDLKREEKEIERLRSVVAGIRGVQIGVFSKIIQRIVHQAHSYHLDRSVPVLIEGETGTGKEVIAKSIHFGEEMDTAPFVDLNCAALAPSLFESELFGYEAGSYTGALSKGQKGKIDMAAGGTLFLDEIGELPLELQGKLLRVLEEKEFYRVGGLKKIKTDVRIICATNVDLASCIEAGSFRKDLYYRLRVGHLMIPPLRERQEEIIPLALFFLREFARQKKKQVNTLGEPCAEFLRKYPWPGNVRELKNTMDWCSLMYEGVELKPSHLDLLTQKVVSRPVLAAPVKEPPAESEAGRSLDEIIDDAVLDAMRKCNGNKTQAAIYLKISKRSLCYRLDKMS